MTGTWRQSPVWLLIAVIAVMFAVGVSVPLEISMYAAAHVNPPKVESLQTSFRVAYLGQWSGFGYHWYNYTVSYAAVGVVWGDLWMTVYFNGTTTPIPSGLAHTVVDNGTVGHFSFLTGAWNPAGARAPVRVGQTMSVDTAEFLGDGNLLFIAAINGTVSGSLSLVIP